MLREGNTIDRKTIMQSPAETSARSFHPNTWRPQELIKTAFREIGGCGVSGSHSRSSFVDWTRRRLQALVTVAGIIQGLFRERAGDLLNCFLSRHHADTDAVHLRRHLDPTPACFHYGSLRGEVEDHGRQLEPYMHKCEFTGVQHVRWRIVLPGQFRSHHPRTGPRAGGVLDVLALHGKLVSSSVATTQDGLPEWSSFQETGQALTFAPRILMRNNASCNMQALNTDTASNIRALRQLSDKGCFCILDDAADGCPSMHRLKQASAHYASSSQRLLYNAHQTCAAHKLHNGIKRSLGEAVIVGNAHAVSYVFALHSRRKQLEEALRHLVHVDLECVAGMAPVEYTRHARNIVDSTILRHESYIGARSGTFAGATGGNSYDEHVSDVEQSDGVQVVSKSVATPAEALMFVNGNLAEARITHWCTGCCTNECGVTTRDIQERNMVSASRLLLGFLFTGQKPALSRWLSTGRMLAYVSWICFLPCLAAHVAPRLR